jgi:hypothetical protein
VVRRCNIFAVKATGASIPFAISVTPGRFSAMFCICTNISALIAYSVLFDKIIVDSFVQQRYKINIK